MTPDEAKQIRKGDVLTIRAIAQEEICNGKIWCDNAVDDISSTRGYVSPEDILSVTPAPREIKVGDPVRMLFGTHLQGIVRAIDNGETWLRLSDGTHAFTPLSNLRHADVPECRVCGHTKEEWAKIGAESFARPTEVED